MCTYALCRNAAKSKTSGHIDDKISTAALFTLNCSFINAKILNSRWYDLQLYDAFGDLTNEYSTQAFIYVSIKVDIESAEFGDMLSLSLPDNVYVPRSWVFGLCKVRIAYFFGII